jgi:benzoate/toluate 1,2-dioxygenase alpha subunit
VNKIANDVMHELIHSEKGVRLLDRRIFVENSLFEQERQKIWCKVWVFVAHESQIPSPRNYITAWIERTPIVISRDRSGKLHAFVNICSHRGSTIVRTSKGNAANFTCPFHGWVFNPEGKILDIVKKESGGYPASFDNCSRDLVKVRLENYRGFLFATLNQNAEPLQDYLAESKTFIDLIVDQSPQGIEVLKGKSTYTFNGNWKMQAENGVDGYHVDATHANYVMVYQNRAKLNAEKGLKVLAAGQISSVPKSGFYHLGNGHTVIWWDKANAEDQPIYAQRKRLMAEHGEVKTKWMTERARNMLIYPNVFLMDQMSTQIRVFRPLAVDKTEVTIYCFAPVGEPPEERAKRIRQYEDFFNVSGMATPDDLMEFSESQVGCRSYDVMRWSNLSRGAAHEIEGPDQEAIALGIKPLRSGAHVADEGIFLAQHERWLELMNAEEGANNE